MRNNWAWVWAMGAAGVVVSGCNQTCTDMGCVGQRVEVALVDDAGTAVAARGEIRYSGQQTKAFDCTVDAPAAVSDASCEEGKLQMDPIYNDADELDIRFERVDGTLSGWQPVPLAVDRRVLPDFNGPGCDCTMYDGHAAPVLVPADAQL